MFLETESLLDTEEGGILITFSRRMPTDLKPISIDDQRAIVNTIEKADKSKCNICKRKFINERAAKIQKSRNHKDQTINDTVEKGFHSCNDRRCKTYQVANFGKAYSGSSTKMSNDINQSINCKTKNVCYLVTCERSTDQYVSETKRQLNHRMNEHKSDFKLKEKVFQ